MRGDTVKKRLEGLLKEDNEALNRQTEAAARRDFARFANEYFERDGELKLLVERDKDGYLVTVQFRAIRVKSFTTIM